MSAVLGLFVGGLVASALGRAPFETSSTGAAPAPTWLVDVLSIAAALTVFWIPALLAIRYGRRAGGEGHASGPVITAWWIIVLSVVAAVAPLLASPA